MKKKNHKNIHIKTIMIVFLLVIFFLITASYILNQRKNLTVPEKILKDSMNAIHAFVLAPFDYFSSCKNENPQLNSALIEELKREIESLKQLNHIEETFSDFGVLNATIRTRELATWYHTVTIDKGSKDGVLASQIVVGRDGLIGQISKVSYFTSEVTLLTAQNHRVSVSVTASDNIIHGILQGYLEDKQCFLMESSSVLEGVKSGDVVSTNGLGGIYPSGIYVGRVKKILDHQDLGLRKLCVVSDVAFDQLKYVSILKKDGVRE